MKIERSSLDQVKKRFETNKKKMEEKKKDYDLEQRLRELKEEVILNCTYNLNSNIFNLICLLHFQEEKLKEYRKEKKKEKKRKHDELDDEPQNDDMAALMGFSGFGTSKK